MSASRKIVLQQGKTTQMVIEDKHPVNNDKDLLPLASDDRRVMPAAFLMMEKKTTPMDFTYSDPPNKM